MNNVCTESRETEIDQLFIIESKLLSLQFINDYTLIVYPFLISWDNESHLYVKPF